MRRIKKVVSVFVVMTFFASGCSAFRPHSETVNVVCEPTDSILVINGQRYASPAQVEVPRNRDVSIQCNKKGYFTAQQTVGHHFNGTGALDAVGTLLILLPGIGLFTPGAWSLDKTDIHVQLFPEGSDQQTTAPQVQPAQPVAPQPMAESQSTKS